MDFTGHYDIYNTKIYVGDTVKYFYVVEGVKCEGKCKVICKDGVYGLKFPCGFDPFYEDAKYEVVK